MHSYDSWILADACKVIKHKILEFNSKQQVFYYKVHVKAKDGGLKFKTYYDYVLDVCEVYKKEKWWPLYQY